MTASPIPSPSPSEKSPIGRLVVVTNPLSGQNKRDPSLVKQMEKLVGEGGSVVAPVGLEQLEQVAVQWATTMEPHDVLCVNGGDGTMHKVLGALWRAKRKQQAESGERIAMPRVALLRGGTMNTISRNIGVKGKSISLLQKVVEAQRSGVPPKVCNQPALLVDNAELGFLFGNGVLSRFLEAYYEGPGAGPWKGAKVLFRAILSGIVRGRFARQLFERTPFVVHLDGQKWQADHYTAICAATVADLGLGFRLFHHKCRDKTAHQDKLQSLGFTCTAAGVISVLHRIYAAKPTGHPGIIDQLGQRITIDHPQTENADMAQTNKPQSYMLDGDFLQGSPSLSVEVGPTIPFLLL